MWKIRFRYKKKQPNLSISVITEHKKGNGNWAIFFFFFLQQWWLKGESFFRMSLTCSDKDAQLPILYIQRDTPPILLFILIGLCTQMYDLLCCSDIDLSNQENNPMDGIIMSLGSFFFLTYFIYGMEKKNTCVTNWKPGGWKIWVPIMGGKSSERCIMGNVGCNILGLKPLTSLARLLTLWSCNTKLLECPFKITEGRISQ